MQQVITTALGFVAASVFLQRTTPDQQLCAVIVAAACWVCYRGFRWFINMEQDSNANEALTLPSARSLSFLVSRSLLSKERETRNRRDRHKTEERGVSKSTLLI
jgi:hypothetical protein